MKIIAGLMLLIAIALTVLAIVFQPAGGPSEADLVQTAFPNGPHWMIRAWEGQGLVGMIAQMGSLAFSGYCLRQGWRLWTGGLGLERAPFLVGMCLLPLWLGVVQTFLKLKLAGMLAHHLEAYLLGLVDEIRLILLVALVTTLVPAAVILLAIRRRHSTGSLA
jgi:hypothetical protein